MSARVQACTQAPAATGLAQCLHPSISGKKRFYGSASGAAPSLWASWKSELSLMAEGEANREEDSLLLPGASAKPPGRAEG